MSPDASLTWSSSAVSHTGKVRQLNEDAYLERSDIGLWVVADGVGGHNAGDLASKTVVEALAQVDRPDLLGPFVDAVEDQLLYSNKQLREIASQYNDDRTIGSTVIVLLAYHQHCIIMWVGDSRAYLYRNGILKQLSRDHSQVEELVKNGIVSPEDAQSHPSANVITKAIGASDDLYVDIDAEGVQPGDTFLLCSDGLYRHITHSELSTYLAMDDIHDCCRQLLALTLERGALDNLTIIVVRAHNAQGFDNGS